MTGLAATVSSVLGPIGLGHFLALSSALFTFGLVTVATRRSAVAILMGIELILNAAAINFVAFSHFSSGAVTGQIFAVFVVVLAAAEATVALAIVLAVFRGFRSVDVTDVRTLKG
jgi:NADH-quinone oxidoreductase subunit K